MPPDSSSADPLKTSAPQRLSARRFASNFGPDGRRRLLAAGCWLLALGVIEIVTAFQVRAREKHLASTAWRAPGPASPA
ncbi:hypothetical protein [Streptomyces sp. H27-C3]|uniref:hypothetical protein n=1 Tax=Streptomyces sp. H27-C3 TaxID=3046305 RepID=UPI0024BBCA0C|nr:hypothetical protein [Streptomyces sp. H27-C3]MDJ0462776.1 hypothetical protein [Streptomyces sp. H27-C3]